MPNQINQAIQSTDSMPFGSRVLERVEVYFCWDPKNKTGVGVDDIGLIEVEITESMFTLLPTIYLNINSKGLAKETYVPKIGDSIHVIITPNMQNDGEKRAPLVEADFCIQEIYKNLVIQNELHLTEFEIIGILNAQTYLNQKCIYPKDTIANMVKVLSSVYAYRAVPTIKTVGSTMPVKKTEDVMREIFDDLSLTLINEVHTNDAGFWFNANLTYKDFAKKLIDHAWISDDDAPLLYVDIDNNAHYTSIKTISENTAYVQKNPDAENNKTYAKTETMYRCARSGIINNDENIIYGFDDVSTLNGSGSILNKGGYKVKQGFFAPLGIDQITDTKNIKNTSIINGAAEKILKIFGLELPSSMHRKTDSNYGDKKIASYEGRPDTQKKHYLGSVNAGMLIPDMNEHYVIAPKHNEMIRRAFFQTFIKMTIDTKLQPEEYHIKEWQPRLGTVINVDASSSKYNESVVSGKYVVVKIVHRYLKDRSFTQAIYGAADGVGSTGQIKPQINTADK